MDCSQNLLQYNTSSLPFLSCSIYWKTNQTPTKQQTLHSVPVYGSSEPPKPEPAFGSSNTKPSIATRMWSLHSSSIYTCLWVAFWYCLSALRQGYVIKLLTPCWVLQELESLENLQAYSQAAIGPPHKLQKAFDWNQHIKTKIRWGRGDKQKSFHPSIDLSHYWCLGSFTTSKSM